VALDRIIQSARDVPADEVLALAESIEMALKYGEEISDITYENGGLDDLDTEDEERIFKMGRELSESYLIQRSLEADEQLTKAYEAAEWT